MLIVIEGLDGVGKSTIAKALSTRLNAELLSTPDPALKKARQIIDEGYSGTPLARQLFYASSVVHASEKIKHLKEQRKIVVVDRYWLSTQVYHNWKCGGSHFQLPEVVNLIQLPDFTIYLSLPLSIRNARLRLRKDNTIEDDLTLSDDTDCWLDSIYRSFKSTKIVGHWVDINAFGDVNQIVDTIIENLQIQK
ncbi:AAA family ATPase [Marinomonas sp. 15G1-11]|uniref:AAA family ATPase n=1 Tax=Marinomonas phaeophyticola TaxID=3004091 RepID=A0ABT4JVS9_9GAMM|nr:AAA family ATPase [Marinomonas sp. 15G1-11]MCZ2722356.1 AAA family ATPase [Marinomonas sp. 15G1-11]